MIFKISLKINLFECIAPKELKANKGAPGKFFNVWFEPKNGYLK